jgi:hypothetical protein
MTPGRARDFRATWGLRDPRYRPARLNRFATPALYGADVIVPTLADIAVVRTS